MKTPALLAALLLLPACATVEPGEKAKDPGSGAGAAGTPAPGGAAGSAAAVEFALPAALAEGDRWFVAVKGSLGTEPIAVRSRRRRGEGFVRESTTWDRTFAAAAAAEHGTEQVAGLFLDGSGLRVSLLDEADRPVGDARLEVAAPFRPGTAWTVEDPSGGRIQGRVVAVEKAETPGGPVEALRVEFLSPHARTQAMTTWYDRGLRPVRMEVRWAGSPDVIEASAALASSSPTPEECKSAVEWAKRNLPPVARP
jgi:hypothetical protein